ncbi:hemerythrin domain-containing protein [Ottowia sp.]|uniref:hemerythrin domain-containing protein n=1 Tax=Ottowia sp. TaxID=1898956 RepID=UPI002639011A|nr:hemerythrin domain-containing protein [Ottowia sp.]
MTTSIRFNIYAPIHKALRFFMTDTLQLLGRLDLEDASEVDAGLNQLESLLDAAVSHLQHENDFIHPAIEAYSAGLSKRIASEHRDHLDAIDTLRHSATALRVDSDPMAAHRLYRQLAAFVAENFEHMDVEETSHNHALWTGYSDAELMALDGRILATVGPDEMGVWLKWLIRSSRPSERVQLMAGLPPEARKPVMHMARTLLNDRDWAKLCRATGAASVPGLAEC